MDRAAFLEIFPLQGSVTLPTKSLQEIVTSVATKVTHFIITTFENANKPATSSHSFVTDNSEYNDMVEFSEDIVKSIKRLIKVVNKTVVSNYSHDEVIAEEIDIATQKLMMAGENLHLCCQVLASTSGEIADSAHNLDLVANISKLFQCLVVLLLCMDNAEVRYIIGLYCGVKEILHKLFKSNTMEELVENFRSFSDSIFEFHSRVARRCDDILSTDNQAKLSKSLKTLQRSMPVITTALSFAIKYPQNEEAVSAKSVAAKQVEKSLEEIIAVIKTKSDGKDLTTDTNIGVFIAHSQSIEKALDSENRQQLLNIELETLVQAFIQNVMYISSYVSHRSIEHTRKAENLVKESRKLLELVSTVVKMSPANDRSSITNFRSNVNDSPEYSSVCRAVRGKMKNIEHCVSSLISNLFAHAFTITDEPLQCLVSVYDKSLRDPTSSSLTRRDSTLSTFQLHANDIVQMGRFIEMCSSDPCLYKDLGTYLVCFSSISSRIIQICSGHNENDFETAEEKLKEIIKLSKEWREIFRNLLRCCVLSMDLTTLTGTLENNINCDFEKCHEDIVNFDDSALSSHVISATGKAKLLSATANHVIDACPDPLFRNGVLAHVKLLNEAIIHMIASGNMLIEDTARLANQEAFLATASHLKTKVNEVCSALLSSSNHPPITSEDRNGLRESGDPDKVSDMLKEMRSLNDKLTNLGFEPAVSSNSIVDAIEEKPDIKPVSEIVDKMFGTSGPPVSIEDLKDPNEDRDLNPETPILSLGNSFLNACLHADKPDEIESDLNEMNEITRYLIEACDDSKACLRRQKDEKNPNSSSTITGVNTAEKISSSKKDLKESFNLLRGYVLEEENPNHQLLTSLTNSWSESCQKIINSLDSVLKVYLVSLRRYVLTREKNGLTLNPTHSVNPVFDLNPSHEGVATMRRTTETLSILLSDVTVLLKRELKSYGGETNLSLVTRLEALRSRSEKVTFDLCHELNDMSSNVATLSENHPEYVHARAIYCAAKLSSLFLLIDVVLQLVLGVRNLDLSLDHFTSHDPDHSHMTTYKDNVHSLCQSALDRICSSFENQNLQPKMILKMKKMENRIDLTRESISDVIDFILKKESSKPLLTQHGHLVFHLIFLHRRFLLDVARVFLVSKALSLLREAEADEAKSKEGVHFNIPSSSPSNNTKQEKSSVAGNSQFKPSYVDRLADLTNQRKDREKELLQLLSDIDTGAQLSEVKGSPRNVQVNPTSC